MNLNYYFIAIFFILISIIFVAVVIFKAELLSTSKLDFDQKLFLIFGWEVTSRSDKFFLTKLNAFLGLNHVCNMFVIQVQTAKFTTYQQDH